MVDEGESGRRRMAAGGCDGDEGDQHKNVRTRCLYE